MSRGRDTVSRAPSARAIRDGGKHKCVSSILISPPNPPPDAVLHRAPRSLGSALDMNHIVDDKNQYRRSLYAEYAVCVGHQLLGGAPSQLPNFPGGGTIPIAQKNNNNVTRHSRIRAHNSSHLMFAAECR